MEVSVEKQFKEEKSHTFLYFGLVLFSAFLITFFGYLNFAKAANPPSIVTYQGKLLNGSVAVTTTQAIKYVLYDAVSGGNALYSAAGSTSSPSTVSTTVNDGFFTIDLGGTGTNTIDPTIFKNNETVYLQVTVGGELLIPRKRITTSPFAINSKYLDGIGASSTPQFASYIPISDSNGSFNFNNVSSTGITVSNLTSASSTFTNATTTGSFWSNLLTATTGWFTNLFWTDATSTGNTHLNTLVATGNTTLATTTISSSTIGALNVSNDTNIGGLLSVTGNSAFGNITSGTWSGTIISNAKGGTGQDSSGWTGFVKATGGVWATSTISSADLSNSSALAFLANNQIFTGTNTFATTTISSLDVTSGTISNLNSTGITVSNLTSASSTFTNATTTGSFWSNLLTATTGWFTNLFWTDATSTGNTHLNTLVATGNTTLATTTISSSTIGALNVSNDTNIGGLLSVTGNSAFGNITSGTWSGTIISNAKGGTGQDSSGWTGFVKATGGVWATSTISSADLSNSSALAFLSNNQIFTGTNTFATTTISSLNVTSGTISNLNATGITVTNLTSASSTFTNATTTGSFWSNLLTATTGWFTNLFWTDATSTGNTHLNTLVATGNTTLATTTISSSTIGALNVSNDTNIGGLLSVTGNSAFGNITSGTWSGTIISNAKGGTGLDSSGWTGFVKATGGVWATSTISSNDLSNSTTIAYLPNNQTFTGLNIFTATTTFATSTFSGYVGIGTPSPAYTLDVSGNIRATGQILLSNGSSSAPSLSFESDTGTGFYRSSTSTVGLTGRFNSGTASADANFNINPATYLVAAGASAGAIRFTGNLTESASTTVSHPKLAGVWIDPLVITNGTAVTSRGYSLFINGPASGPTSGNFALGVNGTVIIESGSALTMQDGSSLTSNTIVAAPGETVFNESSLDIDFRIESDNLASMFKLDAGLDALGIGAAPTTGQFLAITEPVRTSGSPNGFLFTGAAHTGITSVTEAVGVKFNLSASKTWAAGAGTLATQREFSVLAPTYNGSSTVPFTITNASTFAISGAPIQGTGVTITNPLALWVQSGKSRFDGDLSVTGSVGIGTTTPSEKLHLYNGTLLVDGPVNPSLRSSMSIPTGAYKSAISGRYAYVAAGNLLIYDIANLASTTLVASSSSFATNTRAIAVAGNYAYLADNAAGFKIMDISNPSSPSSVSSINLGNNSLGVAVSGRFAYVANGAGGLKIIDIANIGQPYVVSTVASSFATDLFVAGRHVYLADWFGGLKIIDVNDPHNPIIATTTSDGGVTGVYVSGKYAFISRALGITIYNISNASSPQLVSNIITTGDTKSLYVSGKYLYFSEGTANAMSIYDISDINNPFSVGTYTGDSTIVGLKIAGKYAYLTDGAGFKVIDIKGADISSANIGNIATNDLTVWENVDIGNSLSIRNGLNIGSGGIFSNGAVAITVSTTISTSSLFSVGTPNTSLLTVRGNGYVGIGTSTPAEKLHINGGNILHTAFGNPTLKGTAVTTDAVAVYVSGKYAYVADYTSGLRIVDISNPAAPVTTGIVSTTDKYANGVYVSGNYAYLTDYNSSIRIVDISNPTSPSLVSDTGLGGGGTVGIYVSGKYAYLANGGSGLTIADISNPNLPLLAGVASTTNANGVYVSGKYAYVADGISGLRVINILDSHSPILVGTVSTTNAVGVYVSGKYAYVAAATSGLKIVDISNPASPVVTSTYATIDARGVYVSGKYAYVADNNLGLLVVDISNPVSPVLIGTYSVNSVRGLYVSGKYAYLTAGINGLKIIDINGLDAPTMNVGNIATNDLTVSENVDVGNNLNIRNGLNLGIGGLLSNGAVAITVSTTVSTSSLFSVGTSTANMLVVMGNGQVFVNAVTTYGLLNNYKMYINAEGSSNAGLGVNGYVVASGYISNSSSLDLAETYPINLSCSMNGSCPDSGDVVCSDATVVAGVKKCSLENNDNIIGIVSANPGFLLGGGDFSSPNDLSGKVKVALAGRVPTKVTAINGAISVGDKLSLSNITGVAAKAIGEVQTVGVAMENFSGGGVGEIIVFVNLGWQNELYRALSVDTNSSTLNVGTELTPYSLVLNGEMTMFNNVLNKLVFNATALFESKTNNSHAFIFNAVNYNDSPDQYLLSLRSNDQPRFSVLSNGDVRASGNIYAASAVFGTSSNPGDLAERVDIAADDTVEPGDVLVVDMNNPDTYRRSSGANQQAVAGVVSTNPTIVVGNGKTEFTSVMAMVGRVPLKVSDENGPIGRGDLLVTASSTGYAMKYDPKKDNDDKMVGVVGVALDPFVGGKGKIMALVRTGWVNSRYESISSIKDNIQQLATAQGIVLGATSTANLNIEKNNSDQLVYSGGDLNLQGNTLLNVASIVGKNNSWTIDESGHFITRLNTSQGEKEMYAIQSPTSEFVFSSSSQLIAGEAKIIFDQTMQDVIDSQQPLKVNITLTSGEAKGIYVSEKSGQGFTVKELSDGTSGATFDWMVVAKRKEEVTGLNVIDTSVTVGENQIINIQTTTAVNIENNQSTSSPSVVSSPIPTPVEVVSPVPAPISTAPVVNAVETVPISPTPVTTETPVVIQ